MRSNKEPWLRGFAAFLWIAVLACAAYAAANFGRKDWRDYTPLEKIGAFTPNQVEWEVLLDGGTEVVHVRGTSGDFVVVFPQLQEHPAYLASVCGERTTGEIFPGSETERTILACLDRGIASGELGACSHRQAENLRARLVERRARP